MRHLGHAVTSVDAPVADASASRSYWIARLEASQWMKPLVPQQAASRPVRGISTSVAFGRASSTRRGASTIPMCRLSRQGSW